MCNSIIITSSEMRGMRTLRSHRPAKLNGHLRANLWWTGRDPKRVSNTFYTWQGAGPAPPWSLQSNHKSILNIAILLWVSVIFTFTLEHRTKPGGLRRINYLSWNFLSWPASNCPSSQLAESQHLKLGRLDTGRRPGVLGSRENLPAPCSDNT